MTEQDDKVLALLSAVSAKLHAQEESLAYIVQRLDTDGAYSTSTDEDAIYAGEFTPCHSSDEEEDSDEVIIGQLLDRTDYEACVRDAARKTGEFLCCAMAGFFLTGVAVPIILAHVYA